MNQTEQSNYCSYVLRMWREENSGEWRATLRDARSGKQHNFAAVAPLVQFLEGVSAETTPPQLEAPTTPRQEKFSCLTITIEEDQP